VKSPDADRAAQVTNAPDPTRPAERAENPVEAPAVRDYADGIGFAAPDLEATLAVHWDESSAGAVHWLSDSLGQYLAAITDPIVSAFRPVPVKCNVDPMRRIGRRRRLEDNRLIGFDGKLFKRFLVHAFASLVMVLATNAGRPNGICNFLKSFTIQPRFYSGSKVRNPVAQKGGDPRYKS
jgi:hypothetical protein